MLTPSSDPLTLALGGDLKARTFDPLGAFFNGIRLTPTVVPSMLVISAAKQTPAAGTTVEVVFQNVSNGYGFYYICAGHDDWYIHEVSPDRRTVTLRWDIPAGFVSQSEYVGLGCMNANGSHRAYDIVHVGKSSTDIITVGPGSFNDYPNFTLANADSKAGDTIIIQDGTYTSEDMRVFTGISGSLARAPKSGLYTEGVEAGTNNLLITPTKFTNIMAQSPFGWVVDANAIPAGEVQHACYIYGQEDFDQEDQDFDTDFSVNLFPTPTFQGFTLQRCIGIKGHVTLNSHFRIVQARKLHFQYCAAIVDLGNDAGFSFRDNANGVLIEYSAVNGRARNCYSLYKGGKNIVIRRSFFIKQEQPDVDQPDGGVTFYQNRRARYQNVYEYGDAGWFDFATAYGSADSAGSFGYIDSDINQASSLNDSYSRDLMTQNCGAGWTDHSLINTNCYKVPNTDTTIGFDGLVGWRNKVHSSGNSYIDQGPLTGSRFAGTCVEVTNSDNTPGGGTYFNRAFAGKHTFDRLIFDRFGYDPATDTTVDKGNLHYAENPGPNNISNGLVHGFAGGKVGAEQAQYLTETAIDYDTYDPLDNGWKYANRIEKGSRIETENKGFDNIFYAFGKLGTWFGDPDYETIYEDESWLLRFNMDLIVPLTTGRSYTGPKKDSSTGTLTWNRNAYVEGQEWYEWAQRVSPRGLAPSFINTPYPIKHYIRSIPTGIEIALGRFSTDNMLNFDKWNIYMNGYHFDEVQLPDTGITVNRLSSGTYSFQLTAVDTVTGESGLTDPVTITIP